MGVWSWRAWSELEVWPKSVGAWPGRLGLRQALVWEYRHHVSCTGAFLFSYRWAGLSPSFLHLSFPSKCSALIHILGTLPRVNSNCTPPFLTAPHIRAPRPPPPPLPSELRAASASENVCVILLSPAPKPPRLPPALWKNSNSHDPHDPHDPQTPGLLHSLHPVTALRKHAEPAPIPGPGGVTRSLVFWASSLWREGGE